MLNKKGKEKKEKIEVFDSKGNKLCPIHRKNWLLVPETHKAYTGFCAHPDCVSKQVSALSNRSLVWKKKIRMFIDLQIYEDFISFLCEELLVEAEKGKPTVMNTFWFRFKMLKFSHRDLAKGYAVLSRVPAHYRKEHQQVKFIDDWEQEVIDNEYEKFKEKDEMHRPEKLTFRNEVNEFVEERYGKEWVLFLNGEINRVDLSKLYRLGIPKLRRIEKGIYRMLVAEFCDDEQAKELWESYGLDGETPLKNIIVHPKSDQFGRRVGSTKRMEQQYYETLAEKINNSTGQTQKDRSKLKKIALKEKELQELKNSLRGEEYVERKETTNEETTQEPK